MSELTPYGAGLHSLLPPDPVLHLLTCLAFLEVLWIAAKNPNPPFYFILFSPFFFSLKAWPFPAALSLSLHRCSGQLPHGGIQVSAERCTTEEKGGTAWIRAFPAQKQVCDTRNTYYFSSEAHSCPLRLWRGDTEGRCAAAGKIKLEVVSHVLFNIFFFFFFYLFFF